MMNDKFSWKRFGLLTRAELAGERRNLLLKLGGFVVFCMVMYMLWNVKLIFGGGTIDSNGGLGYVAPRFFVGMGMGFIIFFNLSGSFKRFFSRGKASAAFMLPAARSEKFLYASLMNLVVVPVVLIIIAMLNDMLWAHLLGFESVCATLKQWWSARWLLDFNEVTGIFVLANGISIFSSLAVYLAGAVIFRRHQFLLTLLANFVLSIPVFIWMQVTLTTDLTAFRNTIAWFGGNDGSYVTLAWSIFWLWLWMFVAWRRFSTLQITK